jgi:hypothetical protein
MKRLFVIPALIGAGLALFATQASAAPVRFPITGINPALMPPSDDLSPNVIPLTIVSTDPFTNSDSQHKTEVGPYTAGWGTTLVSVFQQGRYMDGGGSDIGWATSTDSGKTWKHDSFKGITKIENPANKYDRASDPSVAYDAKKGVWVASILPLTSTNGSMPVVTTSKDGLTWTKPVLSAPNSSDLITTPFIGCDNYTASAHYGNCYIQSSDQSNSNQLEVVTTKNGGVTFTKPFQVVGSDGVWGQPVVLPNGTALVVYYNNGAGTMNLVSSTNGGTSWGNDTVISPVTYNPQAGGIRSQVVPSVSIDGGGKVYVAWPDCSFRRNCALDDIVYSTSTDGKTWTAIKRVPIDAVTSTVDHFIPAFAVDPSTMGNSAHIGLTYFYYLNGGCSTCKLYTGYINSHDGGATWSTKVKVAGPMLIPWLPSTTGGNMVGDYQTTAFASGKSHGVFGTAKKPVGSVFNEYMVVQKNGGATLGTLHGPLNSWQDRQVSHRAYSARFYPNN